MPLTIQYALAQSNSIDEVCREVADVYMQDINELKKYKFDIDEKSLKMGMEDIVVELAERNVDKLKSSQAGIKKVGYFRVDDIEDSIGIRKRNLNREWEEKFPVINKDTGSKEAVKDSKKSAINYAEYKAKETGNDYEVHIKKVDKYNTSLEVEVGPSVEDNNEDKVFVVFWFIDSGFGDMDFLDGGYNGFDTLY